MFVHRFISNSLWVHLPASSPVVWSRPFKEASLHEPLSSEIPCHLLKWPLGDKILCSQSFRGFFWCVLHTVKTLHRRDSLSALPVALKEQISQWLLTVTVNQYHSTGRRCRRRWLPRSDDRNLLFEFRDFLFDQKQIKLLGIVGASEGWVWADLCNGSRRDKLPAKHSFSFLFASSSSIFSKGLTDQCTHTNTSVRFADEPELSNFSGDALKCKWYPCKELSFSHLPHQHQGFVNNAHPLHHAQRLFSLKVFIFDDFHSPQWV